MMHLILRHINGRWEVAAQDVRADALSRTMRMWRVLGYRVMSAPQP